MVRAQYAHVPRMRKFVTETLDRDRRYLQDVY